MRISAWSSDVCSSDLFSCNFLPHVAFAVCAEPLLDEMTPPPALYQVQSRRGVGPPPGSLRAHQATLSTSPGSTGIAAVPPPDSDIDIGDVVFAVILRRDKSDAPFGPPSANPLSSTVALFSVIFSPEGSAFGSRFSFDLGTSSCGPRQPARER